MGGKNWTEPQGPMGQYQKFTFVASDSQKECGAEKVFEDTLAKNSKFGNRQTYRFKKFSEPQTE